ncbi:conserved unknown protein [Ectocarpus siliculosus]|uniref:Large ribosomal subunit protein mL40 n=1 Tax=Ectocarpus siliculosus TaxID=2880 RepID=D7FZB4_ECTSI|nr:conserved unknown protein [Ectocarpus siliculosus]|eukprot:CBJ32731.1 conserved unknown protein [Ectocarpus siliculosus]
MLRPAVSTLSGRSVAAAVSRRSFPGVCAAGDRLERSRTAGSGGVVGCRRGMMMAAKPGKIKKERSGKALDKKTMTLLKLLDARPEPMPELSAEEKQRNFDIGRRYNSKMATSHNERMADLTTKIKLRDDAIAHLPELLQHAARQPDRNPPPLNRRVATYTPPIPGFDKKDYGLSDDEDADAQLNRFRDGY